jgi:transcriptional regulator with XRE-family HTH domain
VSDRRGPLAVDESAPQGAYEGTSGRWVSEGRRLLLVAAGALTRRELGALLGMTPQGASRLLAGDARPGLEVAVRIERFFGIAPRAWCEAPASKATGSCWTEADPDRTPNESKPRIDAA